MSWLYNTAIKPKPGIFTLSGVSLGNRNSSSEKESAFRCSVLHLEACYSEVSRKLQ
jgi:hypothetical protein